MFWGALTACGKPAGYLTLSSVVAGTAAAAAAVVGSVAEATGCQW